MISMARNTVEIMADEQHRKPLFNTQFINQRHNLTAQARVKRSCRFIGDQERWAVRNRSGNHHALALAT